MSSKKLNHPVIDETPHAVLWPGFCGEMEWGPWFVVQWPVNHPDSHCNAGEYQPDEEGLCKSCNWVPADADFACPCGCGETENARSLLEKNDLRHLFARMDGESLYPFYLAYVDKFRDKISGSPDFNAILDWVNNLKPKKFEEIAKKFPGGSVSISIAIGSSLMGLKSMFKMLNADQLENVLESPDLPEEARIMIHARLAELSESKEDSKETPKPEEEEE